MKPGIPTSRYHPPSQPEAAPLPDRVQTLARTLWDWLRIGEDLRSADAILVFGSADPRSAARGARLLLDGLAPRLVISGGRGPLTLDWPKTEAETFADEAVRLGVPRDRILLETRSTNTGENVRFTRELIEEGGQFQDRGIGLRRWILVHTPYVERRTRATFAHYWPGKDFVVTSHPPGPEDFPHCGAPSERLVHRLVGEVHRMIEYPARGWQAPGEIPERVLSAWRELVELGYRRGLIS